MLHWRFGLGLGLISRELATVHIQERENNRHLPKYVVCILQVGTGLLTVMRLLLFEALLNARFRKARFEAQVINAVPLPIIQSQEIVIQLLPGSAGVSQCPQGPSKP